MKESLARPGGPACALTPGQLARFFPFHFTFDDEARVVFVGPGCATLVLCAVGDTLASRFTVISGPALDQLASAGPEELVVLQARATGIALSGHVVPAGEAGSWVFLGQARGGAERSVAPSDQMPSLEELQQVVDCSLDGIVLMDAGGVIRFWNRQAEALLGHRADQVVGRTVAEVLIPTPLRQSHIDGTARYLALGEPRILNRRIHVEALHAKGTLVPVELTLTTWTRGGAPLFCGYLRDDRQRLAVEAELRDAKEAAEGAAASKARFLARVSHELRTPLNAILGMTGLALDETRSTRVRECLTVVRHSGTSLLDLVNDVLDFSKIDAGKLELELQPFNLEAVVEETAEMFFREFESRALAFGMYLDPALPSSVIGDPGRLRQVLVNLLGNAAKYTDAGAVTLEVEPDRDAVSFTVTDSGIGIDASAQAQLFQPFAQVHPVESRKRGGTGLGLAISAELARMMHGEITVESEPGRGSRFRLHARLPAAPGGAPAVRRDVLADTEVVLLMSATPARDVLARQLRAWGAHVVYRSESRSPGAAPTPRAAPRAARQFVLLTGSFSARSNVRAGDAVATIVLTEPPRPSRLLEFLGATSGGTAPAPLTATSLAAMTPRVRAGARILVVEDNAANQRTLVWLLKRWDLRVDVAGDGVEAVESVRRFPYDLVIMDCQMPRMNGVEATQEIRREERGTGRHVPIVALTANAFREDRERCLQAGMDDYYTKPFEPPVVAAVIRRFVGDDTTARAFAIAGEPEPEEAEPVAAAESAAVPAGVDYPRVVDRLFAGSLEGYLEICGVFADSSAGLQARLSEALHVGDARLAARVAHQLAGAAGNVGAQAAAGLLRRIEERANAGAPMPELTALATEVHQQLTEFRTFVESLRSA